MQKLFTVEWEYPASTTEKKESGYEVVPTLDEAFAFCKEQFPGETLTQVTAEELAEQEGMPVEEMRECMLPQWANKPEGSLEEPTNVIITITEYNNQGSASPKMWRMLVNKLEAVRGEIVDLEVEE